MRTGLLKKLAVGKILNLKHRRKQALLKRQPKYFLDTRQLYKIWFSKNPAVALGIENELRLIRFRQDNPHATISLIYSSRCLNPAALLHLQQFCSTHRIQLLDFETEIKGLLTDISDKAIYALAKKEILKTIKNEGGNLGAASDCTRTLMPLIQKCGIYSDLDVHLAFQNTPRFVKVKAPVVFPVDTIKLNITSVSYNTDCIGFAKNSHHALSPQAIQGIRCLQRRILSNYKSKPVDVFFRPTVKGLPLELLPGIASVIDHFFDVINPHGDIFDFRKYLQTLSMRDYTKTMSRLERFELFGTIDTDRLSEKEIKEIFDNTVAKMCDTGAMSEAASEGVKHIQHLLQQKTVCSFSGPNILETLVKKYKPKVVSLKQGMFSARIEPQGEWKKYCHAFEKFSLKANGLAPYYFSKNTLANMQLSSQQARRGLDSVGLCCDQAWTPLGERKKLSREATMNLAASLIQRTWHKHRNKASQHQESISKLSKTSKILSAQTKRKSGSPMFRMK